MDLFISQLHYEFNHYKIYGHGPNTITPGFEHLLRILDFLVFRLISPINFISFFLFWACSSMDLQGQKVFICDWIVPNFIFVIFFYTKSYDY